MAALAAASNPRLVNPDAALVQRFKAAATTITAGEAVYLSAADTVAIADKDTYANAQVIGIALETAAAAGQWIAVCLFGVVTGYTLTAGADIWLFDDGGLTETFDGSDVTANGDLAAGDFACRVGIAVSTTDLLVNPQQSGAALAA